MPSIDDYLSGNRDRFETLFFDALRIPSVSADPAHAADMRKAAQWFADRLHDAGLTPEIIETSGHPIVYAETPPVAEMPVVLVYGHYDVQPPDPLDLWETPPFEPTVRNGNVFARGATDDKGQVLTHVFAAETFLQSVETPPFQIKFVIEGEEEVGSKEIGEFLHSEVGKKKLACDCIVVSDSQMLGPGQPAITYGLRGIAAFELFLTGPNRDLHSGGFGGSVFNPAIALARILAMFANENGVIRIPHFYDDVLPLTERESNQIALLPFDERDFCEKLGIAKGFGEAGFSTMERRWARPTFDVNGLTSGYQGEGSKTIIPSKASAKFTFRLVPNQDPKKIAKNVLNFIESLIPPGIAWQLQISHGAEAMRLNLDESDFIEPMAAALEKTFACPPTYIMEGGSIPIVGDFHKVLDADVLLVGWGQDDDSAHSPNEKFSLTTFHDGIAAGVRFFAEIARRQQPRRPD